MEIQDSTAQKKAPWEPFRKLKIVHKGHRSHDDLKTTEIKNLEEVSQYSFRKILRS